MLQTPADFESCVDRAAPCVDPSLAPKRFLFRNHELCVTTAGTAIAPSAACPDDLVVGSAHGQLVLVGALGDGDAAAPDSRFSGLRGLFGLLPLEDIALAGRAVQLLDWDRSHRFCGVCATPTERATQERSRRCPACGQVSYPRISPAMMCLVTRGRQILLARNVSFTNGVYSALAGFLEAGESVEDALHREVREEVGITVGTPRYFASQSWPFPNSLMIAFTAEYQSGVLTPNGHEIAEADWFDCDDLAHLPKLPPPVSIARALIEHTLQRLRNIPS